VSAKRRWREKVEREEPQPAIIPGSPFYSRRNTPLVDRVKPVTPILAPATNKFGAKRSYSALCGREFASQAERQRGEELHFLEMAGEITDLVYQPKWVLSAKPHVTYSADFQYDQEGQTTVEDVKGFDTDASRVRRAWVKQLHGVEVKLVKRQSR